MKSLSLTFLALLIFIVTCYFVNYKPIDESRRTVKISTSISSYTSFSALFEDFKNALALNTFGDDEVRERMGVVSRGYILPNELFHEEGALKFLETTVHELEKGISENYYNLEDVTRLIELYNKISFYEPAFTSKAESLIRWCMGINPRYEWLYYALADTYKLDKEYTKMFEIVSNMVTLDPRNDKKQLKLALAAIFMKKDDIVEQALKEIADIRKTSKANMLSDKAPVFEINELFLIERAYSEVKNYEETINYLNKIIIMIPKRAKLHYELANAYLNLGDNTNALKEINKAAELDPSVYSEIAEKIGLLNK